MATKIRFQSEKAPCGRIVDGEHYRDEDDEGLVIDRMYYACGCRTMLNQYHDGSGRRTVVRHGGSIMVDELSAEHGA
jgi:hypothetical protein